MSDEFDTVTKCDSEQLTNCEKLDCQQPVTDCDELADEYKRLRAHKFDTSKYVVIPGDGNCSRCCRPYETTDIGIPISQIPDDLMALAAIAVSITDRRVVFSDCTEVESLEEAANNLTPETRELIEDWKARK